MNKNLIRNTIINKRNSLDRKTINFKSNIIVDRLLNFSEYKNSHVILSYANTKSEVETINIFNDAIKRGKIIAYPKVINAKQMEFYVVKSIEELEIGYKGILEPITNNKLDLSLIKDAILITPGTVFSKDGYRMGYGKGYYDRFIARFSPKLKVGLAFELQISDDIIINSHDQKLDMIITEDSIYK